MEGKEKLMMAQARSSLGRTIPPSDPSSVRFSKQKTKSTKSGMERDDFPSKRYREDKQPNPSSELETSLSGEAPCKLQEIATRDLMRVGAVIQQLTQQCTAWQREQAELMEKVEKLEREKLEIELKLESEKREIERKLRAKYDHRLIESERHVSELKDWSEKIEKALLKYNVEVKKLERKCSESFNAGRAAGEREFVESEEYKARIREARVSGAKDFKKSCAFEQILATEAAAYEVLGFIKCQSQIFKLGGFKPGFDIGLLNSSKNGNLESPTP